jgi:hypothetical protein
MNLRFDPLAYCIVLCVVGTLAGCGHPEPSTSSAPASGDALVIRGGWLFDGVGDARVRNTGIVIREGRFAEVGADLVERDLAGAEVIDLDDTATILPGMFDLHAHYNLDLVDDGRAEEVTYNAILFLANGVTSTWSAGEFFPERALAARDRIERGDAVGTRIFASGPYFGAFRCEYQIETAQDDCAAWPNDITEQEIRAEVDRWADRGVTSIKIKQASPEETRVLIDQAHRRGMTTTGHLANYQDEYDVPAKDANGAALGVPYEQLFWRSGVAQSARVGDWKLNVSGSDKVWLYDLATDPGEETNLAEARPDKLAELQSALAQHNADQPMTADSA